jgi:hypothetical protein
MKSYKGPTFQERVGRAAEAKQKALDNLRSRPPVDEEVAAARRAAQVKREAAEAEKRAAKKENERAAEEARLEEEAKSAETAAAAADAAPLPPTEAERKLARDARYAARKRRK